jgi:phosphoribosylformimino-5-aminoimidazole carboxamide ribotide isomerase
MTSFEVIPSIDLLKGQVVRLERGDYDRKTVFADDPLAVAIEFEGQGAKRLHVVDLEGAASGEPANRRAVSDIIQRLGIPVQVAGGIRSIEAAEDLLAIGADRVVIGTKALTDGSFLLRAVDVLGGSLVIAPDARAREVRISGWTEGTGEDVADAAKRLAGVGVQRLLVTDIGTDGMLTGPNVDLLAEVAAAAQVPVIASGGVSTIDDLRALARVPGLEGAIVGKALYVGAFDLGDAIKAVVAA